MASSLPRAFSRRAPVRFLSRKREAVESFVQFARGGERPRFPLEIFLEVSNVCDLRCVMCPRFSAFNPARKQAIWDVDPGFLDPDPATRALGPLLERALVVHAFGYGEPTIHPSFPGFLEHVAQYEVLIDFFTNGMHLTEDLVRQLVELSVHQITVSFSGASAEVYESVYQGGDFERVLAGLGTLRDAKRAARTTYPLVNINSLTFEHHVAELDRFVEMMAAYDVFRIELTRLLEHPTLLPALNGHAANLRSPEVRAAIGRAQEAADRHGVALELHPMIEAGLSEPELAAFPGSSARVPLREFAAVARSLPVLPKSGGGEPAIPVIDLDRDGYGEIRRKLVVRNAPAPANARAFYCLEPFKTLYVRRGGQVKTCCYMRDDSPAVGDIHRWTGEEIWNGRGYETVRGAIVNGQYPLAACRSCLETRQAPSSHGADLMIRHYSAWQKSARGFPFDAATADELVAVDGLEIASRLFRGGAGGLLAPEAHERTEKLFALLDGVTLLDSSWSGLVEGWIDRVSPEGAAGWVWSPLFPDLRLPVSLWVGPRKMGRALAKDYRADLAAAGKGDGRFGFSISARLTEKDVRGITVRLGETACALGRSDPAPPPGQ